MLKIHKTYTTKCIHACSVAKLCPTLFNSVNCSSLGSSVHGILQAKMVEWVAISSSSGLCDPRIKPQVTFIERWIVYHWTTWEASHSKGRWWDYFVLNWLIVRLCMGGKRSCYLGIEIKSFARELLAHWNNETWIIFVPY